MSEMELRYLASVAKRSREICEVGSWLGRSSCAIAENTAGHLTCVDTWMGTEEQGTWGKDILADFLANMTGLKNVTAVQLRSVEAAKQFAVEGRKFDMIFLDAKHDYESISEDIRAWSAILRDGGILLGHDFHPNWPGVMQAVHEQIQQFRVVDTIWTTETN
ncbi:MAG: class I SAM-dependent methyltransferase [Candidatus Micrarchaeota archaeon]|nr:class I SAM-dependent methyltransferase [Candidatus Micrarchaeota archaeon]